GGRGRRRGGSLRILWGDDLELHVVRRRLAGPELVSLLGVCVLEVQAVLARADPIEGPEEAGVVGPRKAEGLPVVRRFQQGAPADRFTLPRRRDNWLDAPGAGALAIDPESLAVRCLQRGANRVEEAERQRLVAAVGDAHAEVNALFDAGLGDE